MPGLRPFSFSVGERKIMNHFVMSVTNLNNLELTATSTSRRDSDPRKKMLHNDADQITCSRGADGDDEKLQAGCEF
jgi:hypothetical protein